MPVSTLPTENPVLTVVEVAKLLRWSCAESFRNNRRKLEAAGFPPKLPGVPGWSRTAVMRWIHTNAGLYADEPETAANDAGDRQSPLQKRFAS